LAREKLEEGYDSPPIIAPVTASGAVLVAVIVLILILGLRGQGEGELTAPSEDSFLNELRRDKFLDAPNSDILLILSLGCEIVAPGASEIECAPTTAGEPESWTWIAAATLSDSRTRRPVPSSGSEAIFHTTVQPQGSYTIELQACTSGSCSEKSARIVFPS
jgi:hypothetical protein